MIRWQEVAAADAQLLRLGRHCNLQLCWQVDNDPWFFIVESGRLLRIERGPFHLRHSDLFFSASRSAWQKFFQSMPPRGFHDILAMSSYFHLQISGNQALLREHLAFLKQLMQIPRQVDGDVLLAADFSADGDTP